MILLTIGGLVTWRLSHMFVHELGPWGVFAHIRAWAARNQKRQGGIFDGLSCVGCTSIYVGAVIALAFAFNFVTWVLYLLAFSALATIIERIYAKLQK